ncbi:MAG: CRISPR-associated endonuclease Cas1 [Chthoniobacter sp.]|uniref:CRISPR-associated endonuclease Cas4g/Cas1g n=1 Tax=Chthoniobacter sp. TaxID=2510640 RepID=UPI0032AD216A
MPTRRSSPKRSTRLGRERERDPAQEELPLDAIQQKIHAALAATLAAPVTPQAEAVAPLDAPVSLCEPPPVLPEEPAPLMPVRRLQNYAYCPRLFYYQWVENLFEENADTVEGSAAHRQTDKPSALPEDPKELELPEGARLRSLQLESETLGLVGKIDVCEGTGDGIEVIDHKKGSARRGEGGERLAKEYDAVQVAAYALLLREQGQTVNAASIYYAADRRRVPVLLTDELLSQVLRMRNEARTVAASGKCPPPLRDDPRCLYCSAYPICLPNESAFWSAPNSKPPELKEAPRPPGDDGELLVVQKPGCTVGQRGGEFVVSEKGKDLQKFPRNQVRAIYLFGAVQLTAQATQSCLEDGIDVGYFSPAGRFLGLLRGLPASGVDARLGQYRMFGERGIRLKIAREVVRAKIHNQRVMLMRNGDAPDQTLRRLADLRELTEKAGDLDMLRGVEGTAAALYFEHFATMLSTRAGIDFSFTERNRRPPRDPLNALLSQGYSILAKELTGVCHAVGLDPFLGFYHQPRYGRPALALDLMEEFRPLIADSVALSLLNRGELTINHFSRSASGCFLREEGRKIFWEAWFRRLDSEVTHPQFGYAMSYRRMLEVQARQLWRYVRGEAERYFGFTTR